MAGGVSLAHSFETRSSVLPVTFVETVRAGEVSGTLDSSFRRLHAYYDRASKLKGKVQAAMAYPIFTMIVAAIVVAIIIVKAVPTFVTSFSEMGTALPWPTRILIAASSFCSAWWPVIGRRVHRGDPRPGGCGDTPRHGCIKQHRWLLRVPVMGSLESDAHRISVCRDHSGPAGCRTACAERHGHRLSGAGQPGHGPRPEPAAAPPGGGQAPGRLPAGLPGFSETCWWR